MIANGTRVNFLYRQHHLLGGAQVSGSGVVQGWTMVGTDRAYVIKPDQGGTVHVRCSGVSVADEDTPVPVSTNWR
jgi:hypothetical protein